MEKLKVIVLYNKLFHYRIPVWNLLAKKCDLTVSYSDGDGNIPEEIECGFNTMYLPARRCFRKFVIQEARIRKLVKYYDAVIAYRDNAWLKFITLLQELIERLEEIRWWNLSDEEITKRIDLFHIKSPSLENENRFFTGGQTDIIVEAIFFVINGISISYDVISTERRAAV